MKRLVLAFFVLGFVITSAFSASYDDDSNNFEYVSSKRNTARTGMFVDLSYMQGPFFDGWEAYCSISGGKDVIFAGYDFGIDIDKVLSKYNTSSYDKSALSLFGDVILGASFRLGFFMPYGYLGAGLYLLSNIDSSYSSSSSSSSSDDSTKVGFHAEAVTGLDLIFGNISIGAIYKLKYMYGGGFTDCYGISAGLTF